MDNAVRSFLSRISRNISTNEGGHRISEFGPQEITEQMRQGEKWALERADGDADWAKQIRQEVRARGLDRIPG